MKYIDNIIYKLLRLRGLNEKTHADLSTKELKFLCIEIEKIFLKEESLLKIKAPCNICGDIHGQFYDLLRMLEYGDHPPKVKYLFMGDFVDRGPASIETIALLYAYKIRYPKHVFLIRGNHECAEITIKYGFFDECKKRYGDTEGVLLWKMFVKSFNALPIGALVGEKIFCIHGGPSPEMQSIEQINSIRRPTDIPGRGLLTDLMWADPVDNIDGWDINTGRGISYIFGHRAVEKLLLANNLDLICRAHEVKRRGYEFKYNKKLITLFSAPNYYEDKANSGAMMTVGPDLKCSITVLKPT